MIVNNKIYRNILSIAIIMLLAFIFMQKCGFSNYDYVESDTITLIQIVHDTIEKEVMSYVPEYITITKEVFIPGNIDTVEVIKEFFTKKYYIDTLQDSIFRVIVYDSIYENMIISRRWVSSIYKETKIIDKTVTNTTHDKFNINIGASIHLAENISLTPIISVARKKSQFGFGYDLINKQGVLKYEYTIFKKR